MIPAADITEWQGSPVVDRDGSKIGALEAVYFDTLTEDPAFVTVRIGLLNGARLVFVPLGGASVSPKSLRVAVDKKLAKAAPAIDLDGQLEAATEPEIYAHYGLDYTPGATGERRLGRR